MSHPYFQEESGISFAGFGFEVAAEGVCAYPGNDGDIFQTDFLMKIAQRIIKYIVDAPFFFILEVRLEANG